MRRVPFAAKSQESLGANKMADNKIAKEMMSFFASANYCEYVQCLSECDAVNIQTFHYTPMGKQYRIDLHRCFTSDGKLNQNHVLEIFGEYSGFPPDELRQKIITIMKNKEEQAAWIHAGQVVNDLNFHTHKAWIEYMSENTTPCDELMLYVLNRIYCRHMVVLTANRVWTTVKPDNNNKTVEDLLSTCDQCSVFLGNHTFGELKRLPMCAPPLPPHTPIPVITTNNKPPSKGRGKGNKNKPANPLKLSVKILVDKRKPRPCSSLAGREQFENDQTTERSDLQGVIEQNQICLNSSNAPVAAAEVLDSTTSTTKNPSVAEAPVIENSSDHSNMHSTVAEVPISGNNQGNQNSCLNSSNIIGNENIVLQPSNLNVLICQYLATHHNLSDEQVNNLLSSCSRHNPPQLSALATSVFQKNYPDVDVDVALTNLTKYNITRNVKDYDGPVPSLDLNALLKTLPVKRKLEVLVPRVG